MRLSCCMYDNDFETTVDKRLMKCLNMYYTVI
jgi:hypothetical protein